MGHYHSKTPKRHVGYSNSEKVGLLNLGKLRGWDYESSKYKSSRTAITKVDQDGKKTFQGCKKQLKDSQPLCLNCHDWSWECELSGKGMMCELNMCTKR